MRCRPATLIAPFLLAGALVACNSDSGGPTAIEIAIESITFTSTCTALIPGDSCRLTVEAFAEDGQKIGNPVLRWTSFNSGVASVSTEGMVDARAPGEAIIEVSNTTATVSARTQVRVLPVNPK